MNKRKLLNWAFFVMGLLTTFSVPSAYGANNKDRSLKEEIRARLEMADSLHSIGKTDSAAIVGKETIELAEKANDPILKVASNSAQGVYLRSLGQVEEALECYNKGLALATSGSFREHPGQEAIEEIASLYINLAVLNLDMQNKTEAAKNAQLSGEWISKSTDTGLKSTILGVAGSVLTGTGDYEKALEFQDLAYKNAQKAGDIDATFRAAAYSMLLADRTGNPRAKEIWQGRCETILPEISAMMSRLVYFQAQCSIALKNDNPKDALLWFDKILQLDGIDNLPFVKYDCYNNMHLAYSKTGDYKDAYETLLKGNELRDSIWEKQKEENLRDLTIKYETKETELALAQSESKRSRTLAWLFAAATLLALGSAFFIAYVSRQRRLRLRKEMEFAALRSETERRLTEEYIGGLENERQRLAGELHDGICNDLLAIQMNIRKEGLTTKTEEMITSCRDSVRRISHELMPPEFHYATLEEVIRWHVSKTQEATPESITIDYTSEVEGTEWNDVPDAEALEVYRILQEALSNAIRHSGATKINVILTLNGESLILRVIDNGSFKVSSKKGIGLESIHRRAKAIGGSVELRSLSEGGTELILKTDI